MTLTAKSEDLRCMRFDWLRACYEVRSYPRAKSEISHRLWRKKLEIKKAVWGDPIRIPKYLTTNFGKKQKPMSIKYYLKCGAVLNYKNTRCLEALDARVAIKTINEIKRRP